MRVILLAFALCALAFLSAAGQGDLIRVRAGHTFKEEFPVRVRYRFPKFQSGTVTYTNGKIIPVRSLNYDLLFEGIIAVQITGDTIVVSDQDQFQYFKMGDAIYWRVSKDKYLEVLEENENAKLAVREHFIVKRRDRKSNDGYNPVIDNSNSVYSVRNSGYGRMVYDQDLLMMKRSIFYIIDNGTVYKSKKSRFIKAFPGHKAEIEAYLDKNYTDFQSPTGLQRLFEYCSTLSEKKADPKAP